MDLPQWVVSVGNYELVDRKLGKGGFAKVMKAKHMIVKTNVALKVFIKDKIDDPYARKHLHRESRILAKIDHPNIARLIEVMDRQDLFILALELIEGQTLYHALNDRPPFPETEARFLIKQLVSALEYLHQFGIWHRDVKLENLVLEPKGRLVLIDFGLACDKQHRDQATGQTHCGSLEYAAPELFYSEKTYGPEVDVWSMGVVLFMLIVGEAPFVYDGNIKTLRNKINNGLQDEHHRKLCEFSLDCQFFIIRCLTVNPIERPAIQIIASLYDFINLERRQVVAYNDPDADSKAIQALKDAMNINISQEKFLDHVQRRPFATTHGSLNLFKLQYRQISVTSPIGKRGLADVTNLRSEPRPVTKTSIPKCNIFQGEQRSQPGFVDSGRKRRKTYNMRRKLVKTIR